MYFKHTTSSMFTLTTLMNKANQEKKLKIKYVKTKN